MIVKDYSHKNLQKASFKEVDLVHANFDGADLRGADFSGADLRGADLSHVKTGIAPVDIVLLFLGSLIVSAVSGYIAMLSGRAIQAMVASPDPNVRASGYAAMVITVAFLVYVYFKGGAKAFRSFLFPVCLVALLIGIAGYVSGLGTGIGMLFLIVALMLVMAMLVVGTIARAIAGSLSNILFIAVALAGGMFGKSVGGGVGTVIMAISCALITKRALKGAPGFEILRSIAASVTKKFGTSFRNSRLTDTNFSSSDLHNTDFSNADVSYVQWGDSKRVNCIIKNDRNVSRRK